MTLPGSGTVGWMRLFVVSWVSWVGWRWYDLARQLDDGGIEWSGAEQNFLVTAVALPPLFALAVRWVVRGFAQPKLPPA
jgi:hypothetical protein